jgi:hypothetical protein
MDVESRIECAFWCHSACLGTAVILAGLGEKQCIGAHAVILAGCITLSELYTHVKQGLRYQRTFIMNRPYSTIPGDTYCDCDLY